MPEVYLSASSSFRERTQRDGADSATDLFNGLEQEHPLSALASTDARKLAYPSASATAWPASLAAPMVTCSVHEE